MKKLLLLSALLIFACSSDDSSDTNDNSNQTFLERFDGVVWEDNDGYLAFYSNPSSIKRLSNECREVLLNTFVNGYSWNITTNNPTTLILDYIDNENNVYTNHRFSVSDDENIITETAVDYGANIEVINIASRTTLTDPCE